MVHADRGMYFRFLDYQPSTFNHQLRENRQDSGHAGFQYEVKMVDLCSLAGASSRWLEIGGQRRHYNQVLFGGARLLTSRRCFA